MSQIDELERRLTAALERIGSGVDALRSSANEAAPAADAGELAELRTALEDEKLANAQLEERLKTIHRRNDARIAEMETELTDRTSAMQALDAELQRLRNANAQLRDNNTALREANAEGVAEPHLINNSLRAELEALRATRAADIAEADAILGTLAPLVENARQPEGN